MKKITLFVIRAKCVYRKNVKFYASAEATTRKICALRRIF